jgi:UDP-N-acetylglucosamine 1-carboxyvinyltransferase
LRSAFNGMERFFIRGGNKLKGEVRVSGAKNVALKTVVAACLTDEKVEINNIPLVSDLYVMTEIIEELGGSAEIKGHKITIQMKKFKKSKIALERAAETRTSAMFMAPLLARSNEAIIPNPGGCRIGFRPIDRIINGFKKMGVKVSYKSRDGYFYMKVNGGLLGVDYTFKKPTHTGTETLIMAGVLAKGTTTLKNCAQEPEIDELINLLNKMGAKINRIDSTTIQITGVDKLNGAKFSVGIDRNEVVTLAIAAIITKGDILIKDAAKVDLGAFIEKMKFIGAGVEARGDDIRFYYKGSLKCCSVETTPYPGFMTDWQAPWAVLMTQADGVSTVHERVYESRFGYASQLEKMGAEISLYNPKVENPGEFYSFNIEDDHHENKHAAKIYGPSKLHDAVVSMTDLRAGATLVLAALCAKGKTTIQEIHHLDRGYEKLEMRLEALGADIRRAKDD